MCERLSHSDVLCQLISKRYKLLITYSQKHHNPPLWLLTEANKAFIRNVQSEIGCFYCRLSPT
jgi:hypothetical protein